MKNTLWGLPRKPLTILFIIIIIFNATVWLLTANFSDTKLLSLGVLAYLFGLRHALDADHIAAIDNVTRKLRQSGQKPVAVGFFFSLGHSLVVILLSLALVFFITTTKKQIPSVAKFGQLLGTAVSAVFLTLIGILNLNIYLKLRHIFKNNITADNLKTEKLLQHRGLISKILNLFYRNINRSYKMLPIGFLFGLGFDTATEIAVLGISAVLAQNGQLPIWQIMIFPLLFTAGVTLLDSIDGIVMLKIYDWAMIDMNRRIFFNMAITGATVLFALIIGAIEWLQILAVKLNLSNDFFNFFKNLNFAVLGIALIILMLSAWLLSYVYYTKKIKNKMYIP